MKVYELMSLLGELEARRDIEVNVYLTPDKLMNGQRIDKDLYTLSLKIDCLDSENGIIETTI